MYLFLFLENTYVKLQINIQFDSDAVIPPENLDAAIKFGIEKMDATDINAYIVAFLRKLLLQREKLEKRILENSYSYDSETVAGSALQSGGEKPEVDQHPERKSRFHAVLSDKRVATSTPG